MADPIIAPIINGIPNPNEVKVVDGLAYNLSQITVANGYFTDSLVVDRRRDPRLAHQDKNKEYRQKNALARIKLMDMDEAPKGSVGGGSSGYKRTFQQIIITTCQTMTNDLDAKGVTADQLKGWLRHDIYRMVNSDFQLLTASAAIRAEYPSWGVNPSVIGLKIVKVKAGPITEDKFPDIYQAFFLNFYFDEFGTNLVAGRGTV